MRIPEFKEKKELFDWLIQNKNLLITSKKATIKKTDSIAFRAKEKIIKSTNKKQDTENELYRQLVINTTNYMDTHSDVHFPGIWKKTLKENKNILFLQEHEMEFSKLIAKGQDLKVFTKSFVWNELGLKANGNTEALIFDAIIRKERNPFMFERYKLNDVTNHSVGMQYIKIYLAINDSSEDYKSEFETWNKYFDLIVNKKEVEQNNFFWVVTEAKVIEGSAVLIGSNPITPTLRNENKNIILLNSLNKTFEPPKSTHGINEPNVKFLNKLLNQL